MADGATVRVDGLKELTRSLRRVSTDYPKELKVIHKEVASIVQERAYVLAPRRSGNLAASIRPLGNLKGGVVAAGKKRVPYAGPIHFGWAARNIEPQPFLTDALHDRQPQVVLEFNTKTQKLIDRVWTTIR